MEQNQTIRSFLVRYLFVFMGVIFAGCFAASATVSLAMSTYFRAVPVDIRATSGWAATVIIAMVIVHSNYLIVRGRPWCAWVMVAILAACLLTVLPTIQYDPHKFIYAEGCFGPCLVCCCSVANVTGKCVLDFWRSATNVSGSSVRPGSRADQANARGLVDGPQAFIERVPCSLFSNLHRRLFLACFAVSASISLASSTYFRGDPERAKYSFLIALVLSLLLALSHFFMIRGRSWGVRAIVVFYLVCLFIVLPTYGYRPYPVPT